MGSVEVFEGIFDWVKLFLETRFCTNASCAQIARQKLGGRGSQRPLSSLKCCFQKCDVHANDDPARFVLQEKERERDMGALPGLKHLACQGNEFVQEQSC